MRRFWWLCCLIALLASGCSDDEETTDDDTGSDVSGDQGGDMLADQGGDMLADTGVDPVERGEYLVLHLADCTGCHTPLDPVTGAPDEDRFMAGNPGFLDIDPTSDEAGLIPSRNLTSGPEGLADWSDAEIMNAFLNGVKRDGTAIHPVMPYFTYHNMSQEDAEAIVAYLRTIPANDQEIPDRQVEWENPAQPVSVDDIPETTLEASDPDYAEAVRGRYMAGMAGVCLECHTPEAQAAVPRDMTMAFAGGRIFPAAAFGLPVPPFPDDIYTRNITPHESGIQGWTAEQVRTVILQGTDIEGDGICPPMPVGPAGGLGGLTEEDALAIGLYVTTIPPIDSGEIPDCTPPSE